MLPTSHCAAEFYEIRRTTSTHRRNHVCQSFSRSVQGLRSSDTPKLPLPIDLLRRPYNCVRTAAWHCDLLQRKYRARPLRYYNMNHISTGPAMPKDTSSRRSNVSWSTESKAEDRSNSVSTVRSSQFSARRMTDSTSVTVVSVECFAG